MFKISTPLINESLPLISANSVPVIDAIVQGLRADRLVQKKLIDFEEIVIPGAAFSFKISHPHNKECAAIIQLTECGRLIKIYIESENKKLSGIGYKFKFYPTAALLTAIPDDIVEFSRSHLFMLAYILLKLSSGYDFVITRDKKKLNTDSPIVALYEACIDNDIRSTVLSYSEPELYESNEREIHISKDHGLAQISGEGVSPMSITIIEIFARMMTPSIKVKYVES